MEPGCFTDKSAPPTLEQIAHALGESAARWSEVIAAITAERGPLELVGRFSGKKYSEGYAVRLLVPDAAAAVVTLARAKAGV